jgi:2-haloacid dehalogenase
VALKGAAEEPVVVFDIGNVLLDWNPKYLFRKIFAIESEVDWFLDNICTMDWNLEQDRGRSWADGVAILSARHPEWADQIAAYDLRWDEMVSGSITQSVAVLERLKDSGRKIYAITNFSHEKLAVSRPRFPFLDRFDGMVVSGAERLLKPDPAIYHRLFERYSLAPESTVFIDDSARNIATAAVLGMKTVHFGAKTDLRAELAAHGVQV